MLAKYFKSISLILFVGSLHRVPAKECYSCEGINCLRTSKITNKATCVDSVDSCVTVFEGSTAIARGCYSTLPVEQRRKCEETSNSECYKCYNSLCNDRGAISCLQCNSEENIDCYSGGPKIESTRCSVSTSPRSYCYTRTSSDRIERGCLIDTNEQLKCLGDSSCEMCLPDGQDSCNRDSVSNNNNSGSGHISIYCLPLLTAWFIFLLF